MSDKWLEFVIAGRLLCQLLRVFMRIYMQVYLAIHVEFASLEEVSDFAQAIRSNVVVAKLKFSFPQASQWLLHRLLLKQQVFETLNKDNNLKSIRAREAANECADAL